MSLYFCRELISLNEGGHLDLLHFWKRIQTAKDNVESAHRESTELTTSPTMFEHVLKRYPCSILYNS